MRSLLFYWSLVVLSPLIACEGNGNVLLSHKTHQPIEIDGNLSEWPGELSEIEIVDRPIDQGNMERILSDNRVTCKSVWDQEYLYLSFFVRDNHLNASQTERDHAKLYLDDMVEFLIDAQLDATDMWLPDDFIYHINILETVKDDRGTFTGDRDVAWNGMAKYAIGITGSINDDTDWDRGYQLEVAIPWTEIGISPVEGAEIGFNFANGDNDGKGRQLFDWMSAWPMRTPSQFGIIQIGKPVND